MCPKIEAALTAPHSLEYTYKRSLGEMVEISTEGVVRSWSWVPQPRRQQPLEHPFAYALIQLDGADSSFIHVVDDVSESDMKTGMRVQARWSETTTGTMTDFVFVPVSTQ